MDREMLIQNVIRYCAEKGEPPTNACANAGVGKSFLSDIKRGQTPSVAKVSDLAAYLGVTTSDLLGESVSDSDTKKEPAPMKEDEPRINIIKVRGRDGSYIEKRLTDEQLEAWKAVIAQLPDADDL